MDRLRLLRAKGGLIHREGRRCGRSCLYCYRDFVLWVDERLRRRLRPFVRRFAMVEPVIGLIVGVSLGVYLLYTLIYPEKF
jgi:K+-transporting ATPase KdpF subunit